MASWLDLPKFDTGGKLNTFVPSLDLDFTTGTLPSGVNFSRANTADYEDINGVTQTAAINEPRFDYDGGVAKGLLIEPTGNEQANYDITSIYSTTGTLLIDFEARNSGATGIVGGIGDGTNFAQSMFISRKASNQILCGPDTSPVNVGIPLGSNPATITRAAFAWGGTGMSAFLAGNSLQLDTNAAPPTGSTLLAIGRPPWSIFGGIQLNGWIRRVRLWNIRLDDDILEKMAS